MKPLTRKQELLAALAEGRVPNITPLTAEEILLYEQAKREAASKNPKWEDIADKPFGEETAEITLISEQNVSFEDNVNNLQARIMPHGDFVPLVSGKTYLVSINGGDFVEKVAKGQGTTVFIPLIGTSSAASSSPLNDHEDGGYYTIIAYDEDVKSIVVKCIDTTTTTIDPTYLPKIAAVPDASGDTPTAAEFNALLAALRNAGYMATDTGL